MQTRSHFIVHHKKLHVTTMSAWAMEKRCGVPSLLVNQQGMLFKIIVVSLRSSQRTCCLLAEMRVDAVQDKYQLSTKFSDMQVCFADHHLFLLCAT